MERRQDDGRTTGDDRSYIPASERRARRYHVRAVFVIPPGGFGDEMDFEPGILEVMPWSYGRRPVPITWNGRPGWRSFGEIRNPYRGPLYVIRKWTPLYAVAGGGLGFLAGYEEAERIAARTEAAVNLVPGAREARDRLLERMEGA